MSLSLKEALQNAGIKQSVKKEIYSYDEVKALYQKVEEELTKDRNLHNILSAFDELVKGVRRYNNPSKKKEEKDEVLSYLETSAKKIYVILMRVLNAFLKKQEEDGPVRIKFGSYLVYATVCEATQKPRFDIKKRNAHKDTRMFVATLRDYPADLDKGIVKAFYLTNTQSDIELFDKLNLTLQAKHPDPVEEVSEEKPVEEVKEEKEEVAEVPTVAEPVTDASSTETTEPTTAPTESNEPTEAVEAVEPNPSLEHSPTETKEE